MVRLVLFDIDGTLIHTGGAGERAFARVCELAFGVPNGTQGLRFAGRTDTGIVREFFRRHQIEPSTANFERFFETYVFLLDHQLAQLAGRILPGVRELLAGLRALPRPPALGLLTGNIRLGAQIKLRHYQLWEEFELGAFGDDHEDRDQIAVLARDRGGIHLREPLAGEQVVVIGDTPLDIQCARRIGAKVLAVATGTFSLADLAGHHPTWAVSDLDRVSALHLWG